MTKGSCVRRVYDENPLTAPNMVASASVKHVLCVNVLEIASSADFSAAQTEKSKSFGYCRYPDTTSRRTRE